VIFVQAEMIESMLDHVQVREVMLLGCSAGVMSVSSH
jgi:hypothetical protein